MFGQTSKRKSSCSSFLDTNWSSQIFKLDVAVFSLDGDMPHQYLHDRALYADIFHRTKAGWLCSHGSSMALVPQSHMYLSGCNYSYWKFKKNSISKTFKRLILYVNCTHRKKKKKIFFYFRCSYKNNFERVRVSCLIPK